MVTLYSLNRFYIKLKANYGLDARALSLMRIGIAIILLADLCLRATTITEHYTNAGAFPFSLELAYWKQGYFSLFQFYNEYWFVVLIFGITALAYCLLLAGYKTQLTTFLSWFLLTSLQNRNTLILQGGDDMLRMLLFWGFFLPWGNYYSFDSRKKFVLKTNQKTLSVASFGYIMLLFSLYFFTGFLKSGNEWGNEGTAIYYALSLDQMALPLGKMLLPHLGLLKFLTVFVRWLEILAPFLLLIPLKSKIFRIVFIFCIAVLHISFSLTLYVGLFYLIGLISLMGLLPESFMNWFDEKTNRIFTHKKAPNKLLFSEKLNMNYYFNTIQNSFLFFCIAVCIIWNIGTINGSGIGLSDRFAHFVYTLRLDQSWGMFAPTVLKDDGWYIMEGTTAGNQKIDINRNGIPVDYTKPTNFFAYIKSDRERKYQENFMFSYNEFIRPYYCEYLLKDWNSKHIEKQITSLQIIFMKEVSVLPNEKQTVTKEILCTCSK